MAQNITLLGASYPDVPAVTLPKTGGGTATFTDVSDTTATASDVLSGKYFYTAAGVKTAGTGTGGGGSLVIDDVPNTSGTTAEISVGGGGGATQHVIHLEFSDGTDTDIDVYYDDALIGTMITAYTPTPWTYNNKTVSEAQLDGVTWYQPAVIPIGVQLIDFRAVKGGYVVNSSTGEEEVSQWSSVSDYTLIDPGMTFSYIGYEWYNMVFYDATQNYVASLYMHEDADTIEDGYAHGTLSPAKIPANASYVRINSYPTNPSSSELSLIRTA